MSHIVAEMGAMGICTFLYIQSSPSIPSLSMQGWIIAFLLAAWHADDHIVSTF